VQSDGLNQRLYLFGGRDVSADGSMDVLQDGFSYNPASREWDEVESAGEVPSLMASTALLTVTVTFLFFGGDDGVMLKNGWKLPAEIDSLDALMEEGRSGPSSERDSLQAELIRFWKKSPFSADVLAYHTITDTWSIAGRDAAAPAR
jgi:solute:Na+ symporter, SSS family